MSVLEKVEEGDGTLSGSELIQTHLVYSMSLLGWLIAISDKHLRANPEMRARIETALADRRQHNVPPPILAPYLADEIALLVHFVHGYLFMLDFRIGVDPILGIRWNPESPSEVFSAAVALMDHEVQMARWDRPDVEAERWRT